MVEGGGGWGGVAGTRGLLAASRSHTKSRLTESETAVAVATGAEGGTEQAVVSPGDPVVGAQLSRRRLGGGQKERPEYSTQDRKFAADGAGGEVARSLWDDPSGCCRQAAASWATAGNAKQGPPRREWCEKGREERPGAKVKVGRSESFSKHRGGGCG
jgi:hypothetical protein